MPNWPELFSVEGTHVLVEPLNMKHESDLREAVADGNLHQLWYSSIPKVEDVGAEIERRLSLLASGTMLPFAVIDKSKKQAVGMTTFMNIDPANKRLEIGSTWYRKSVQRTRLNTECKFLLLQYAFEELGCIAVEFRTHFANRQSRKAIERLGAKLDGILRSHMMLANGTVRDTAVYSIIAGEWHTVKALLEWELGKPRN